MTYVTLKLDNCFLVSTVRDDWVRIDGSPIAPYTDRWFQDPAFIASLATNTWGSVIAFVKKNEDELRAGIYTGYFISDLLSTPEEVLSKPVVKVNLGNIRDSTSVLFTEPQGGAKPYVQYDGFSKQPNFPLTKRSTAVFLNVYSSAYVRGLNSTMTAVRTPSQVMNYTYRPDYKFMAMPKEKTECFFGLELEVNSRIPWDDVYRTMTEVFPVQEPFIFAKSDSSISGDFLNSYEIVSHPMSPRRMRAEFRILFTKLERLLKEKNMVWEENFDMVTKSTGIHVHVSKTAFTPLSRTHMKKFMLLWNTSGSTVSSFTSQLACRETKGNHYIKPAESYRGRSLAWMLREGKNSERYAACNETRETVEVRVFRGQPCLKAVCHAIDTTEAMLKFTEQASMSQLNRRFPTAFKSWLGKQNKNSYRSLKETLKCA